MCVNSLQTTVSGELFSVGFHSNPEKIFINKEM